MKAKIVSSQGNLSRSIYEVIKKEKDKNVLIVGKEYNGEPITGEYKDSEVKFLDDKEYCKVNRAVIEVVDGRDKLCLVDVRLDEEVGLVVNTEKATYEELGDLVIGSVRHYKLNCKHTNTKGKLNKSKNTDIVDCKVNKVVIEITDGRDQLCLVDVRINSKVGLIVYTDKVAYKELSDVVTGSVRHYKLSYTNKIGQDRKIKTHISWELSGIMYNIGDSVRVTTKSGELAIGKVSAMSDLSIEFESKQLGVIEILIDNVANIEHI